MSGGPGVAARAAGFVSRLARAGRAPACLPAAVCLALLLSAVAAGFAQPASAAVLTSNIGQSTDGSVNLASSDLGVWFAAGNNGGGYWLTSVEISFKTAPSSDLTVKLATGASSTSGGTVVATLTNPSSLTAGTLTFAAPANTYLQGGSAAHDLFIEASSGEVNFTNSSAEDAGGQTGSGISSTRFQRARTSTGGWNSPSGPLKIRTNGTVIPVWATGAKVNGRTLTVAFNKALSTTASTSVPPANRFRYTRGDGRIPHIPKSVAVSGSDVTLTLRHTVEARETVTVSYVAPNANPRLQDTSNIHVSNFSLTSVTNETSDVKAPTVTEAYTLKDGGTVELVTSEAMAAHANLSGFTVKVNGTSRSLTRAAGQVEKVGLVLSSSVTAGQTVTVSYSGTTWEDSAGNKMAPFTDMPVENRVPANATIESVAITSTPSYDADSNGTPDTYQRREDINITVTFDKDVTWTYPTGSAGMRLRLRVGSGSGSAKVARLVTDGATSGTARALTFRYRVASADADTDGVSVEPVSGFLVIASGNAKLVAADGGSVTVAHAGLAANAGHKVDATRVDNTAPTVVSRTLDGETLTITFNERLREASVPGNGRFTVNAGGTVQTVESVAVSGKTVTLTLASSVKGGTAVTVSYTKSGTAIEDVARNDAANFTGQTVTNNNGADTAPNVVSATVNGTSLVLTFDEALSTSSSHVPPGTSFRLYNSDATSSAQGSSSSATVSGRTVTVTLAQSVPGNSPLRYLVYNPPTTGKLQDAAGNEVARISGRIVTNELNDKVPPKPSSGTASGRTISLTFDKTLEAVAQSTTTTLRKAFFLSRRGHEEHHPNAVSVSGTTVTLTFAEALSIEPDEKFYVLYDPTFADEGDRLVHEHGTAEVAAFIDFVVTNSTAGGTGGPTLALDRAPGIALLYARGDLSGSASSVIRIAMSEPLDPASAPAGSAFEVRTSAPDGTVTTIAGTGTASILGSEVEVTLASGVADSALASVSYTKPSANPLQDLAGNDANDFSTNRVMVVDEQPPNGDYAFVAGTRLTLTYHEALDADSVPADSDFSVKVGTAAAAPPSVAVAGNGVLLTLASSVASGETVKLSYTAGSHPVRDPAGNDANNLTEIAVVNRGPTDPGKPALRATGPAQADGAKVTLFFRNARLDPSSVPPPSAFALVQKLQLVEDTNAGTFFWYEDIHPAKWRIVGVRIADAWNVELALNGPVHPCDREFAVTYTKPATNRLRSLWGTEADAIQGDPGTPPYTKTSGPTSGQTVTNGRADDCVGGFASARTGSVILRAKRAFAAHSELRAAWFTVAASGGPVRVTGAAFSPDDPKEVKLTVSRDFAADETVTVSYARPVGERGLWDTGGNQLEDVTDMPVTNTVAAPAAGFVSAAVPAHGMGVSLTFSGEISSAGIHTHYAVEVDGAARSTTRAFWQGDTVGLVLTEPVRAGAAVTVRYTKPGDGAGGLIDAAGRAVASFGPEPVENTVAAVAPLTASFADVPAEHDGESLFRFELRFSENFPGQLRYRMLRDEWLQVTNGRVTGARRVAQGRNDRWTIEVEPASSEEVTVTLPAGSVRTAAGRTLSAAAAATIPGPAPQAPPLTASFVGVPAEHDGRRFSFELRFSENFPGQLRYKALRDEALQATNGRVVGAKRVTRGQNQRWTIEVKPASFEDVTITLPATTDCAAAGAVCTPDGRKLSEAATATVLGPVALSVADAEATEGADEAVAFRVSLGRAASRTVTVDYATADGTATAGEDYTATNGTLSFAAGEREKTVSVPILDDALDEGRETFALRLSNATGARIADGEATGTIVNADPLQKMWLARFGRTVAGHVTEAVSDRLAGPLSGAQVTVGGQTVDLAETGDEAWLGRTLTSVAQALGAPTGPEPEGDAWPGTGLGKRELPVQNSATARDLSGRELLLGSAFHLARAGDGATPGLAAWGRVTVGGFDGEAPAETGSVRIDGNVTTGILGADAEWNRLLAGVAISVSEGEGSFSQPGVDSGEIESTMTTVSPYARFMVSDRVSVWGLAGWGTGDMTIVQAANDRGQPERITRTDLEMRLAALGGRGVLLEAGETGFMDLALKADAFHVETESAPVSNEGATTAAANRLRLILEGSRAFDMGDGAVLTPGVELGLRHDGGDAETGTGVELGGGVSWADPGTGLSVEAKARMLVAHADSDYEEWGVSGAVRLAPGERGRGLSFSLAPTLGQAASGTERLWGVQRPGDIAPGGAGASGGFETSRGLQGELGYGLALFGDRFTGTPNVGYGLSDAAREYRIGWRLTSVVPGDPGFEVSLDATRTEPANDNGAGAGHGVMLRGAIRW